MRRIIKVVSAAIMIGVISYSLAAGQNSKSEQKIKIVITDDDGTEVIVDTLLKDCPMKDSIKLKDGKVIVISDIGDKVGLEPHNATEHVFITVNSDGKESKKIVKEITIVSSDTANCKKTGKDKMVYVYCDSKTTEENPSKEHKVITRTIKQDGGHVEKRIYINDDKVSDNEIEKTYEGFITTDDKETAVEKTRFVIAKDGLVVTVEGNDESKTKDLVKEIEKKLGIKREGGENNEMVKVETKKKVKK